jgi:hypothetical protein
VADARIAASIARDSEITWGNLSSIPSGFADGVDNTGIAVETDPTVPAWVKDGPSWTEITGIPSGFADGTDNVGITSETDPQVGSLTLNRIPKWHGTYLDDSSIHEISGKIGIGTATPKEVLHVHDRIRIGEDYTYPTVYGEIIHEGAGTGFRLNAHSGGGWSDIYFQTDGTTRMFIEAGGNVGIGTTTPSEKLTVVGNLLIESDTTGQALIELGEGLDFAEGFSVSQRDHIEPGSVLVIDPDNPGKLRISSKPYDTKVAGIVAGANGLGSGVRLGADQFDFDVALAGRVYCNVETANGDILPGDLLTTSATPGFAMKVDDHNSAQGAILGKAMQALPKGQKGQILVLVTLQ